MVSNAYNPTIPTTYPLALARGASPADNPPVPWRNPRWVRPRPSLAYTSPAWIPRAGPPCSWMWRRRATIPAQAGLAWWGRARPVSNACSNAGVAVGPLCIPRPRSRGRGSARFRAHVTHRAWLPAKWAQTQERLLELPRPYSLPNRRTGGRLGVPRIGAAPDRVVRGHAPPSRTAIAAGSAAVQWHGSGAVCICKPGSTVGCPRV